MVQFQGKNQYRRYLYSFPSIFLLVVALVFSVGGLRDVYEKKKDSEEKASEALAELHALETRYGQLEGRVAELKTSEGKEEEIRRKFMVVKEGEGILYIVDEKGSGTSTPPEETKSLWSRFLQIFQ